MLVEGQGTGHDCRSSNELSMPRYDRCFWTGIGAKPGRELAPSPLAPLGLDEEALALATPRPQSIEEATATILITSLKAYRHARVHAVPASAVPTQRLTTDVHERGHCRSLLCVAIRSAPKRSTCADLCIGQVVRHDDELSVWFEQPADAGDETFIEEVVAMFLMIVPSRWLREGHKHTVHGCLFEVVMAKDCRVATEDSQIAQGSEDSALEDGRAAVVAQLERAPELVWVGGGHGGDPLPIPAADLEINHPGCGRCRTDAEEHWQSDLALRTNRTTYVLLDMVVHRFR